MSEIRTTKIDWVEFVTYKDYLRVKEEKQELEYLWDINEELKEENKAVWILIDEIRRINENLREENKKLKSDLEQFSEAYKRYRDYEKEELAESCYDLERENKKLKEERDELKKEFQQYKEHYNIEKDKQRIFLMTWLRY